MKVALDCNALIAWSSGRDSDDGARLGALFARTDVTLVVPMPAFAEFVVGAHDDDVPWLDALMGRSARFRLAAIRPACRLRVRTNSRPPCRGIDARTQARHAACRRMAAGEV